MRNIKHPARRLLSDLVILVCTTFFGCSQSSALYCEGIDCSGHGTCFENEDSFVCICDEGYIAQGPNCVLDEADADVDHDADIENDTDRDDDPDGDRVPDTPACEANLSPASTHMYSHYPNETRGLSFYDLSGDGFDEAIISGTNVTTDLEEEDGIVVLLNEIDSRDKSREFHVEATLALPSDFILGTTVVGNLDADAPAEILAFLSLPNYPDSPGQLLIVDDILTKKPDGNAIDVDAPLIHGTLADLDGDLFEDIVALSWNESTDEGQILAWQRLSAAIPDAPTSVYSFGGRQPFDFVALDADFDHGHEFLISFVEGLRLIGFDGSAFSEINFLPLDLPHLDMAVIDLWTDEITDVLVATGLGGLWHVEIIRDSTFFAGPTLIDDSFNFLAVTAADFDGDGDSDIFAADNDALIVFCNDNGEFIFYDEIPHAYVNFDAPMISAFRLGEDHAPDIMISEHSMILYNNE